MRIKDLTESSMSKQEFKSMLDRFYDIAMEVLDLDKLPDIKFTDQIIQTGGQPSFGMYIQGHNQLFVSLTNRHPMDILRTMAHELTHYKQDLHNELNDDSGRTGSPQENEAHHMAGIIMRMFAKKYPRYMLVSPMSLQ